MSESLELQRMDAAPPPAVQDQGQTAATVLGIIGRAASDPSVDVDKMERLLAMHERILNRDAELAFNAAMRTTQEEIPRIVKDAKNTQTGSLYARLESMNEKVVPIYTKNGFSLSFGSAQCEAPETIRVTCKVMHAGGHSRDYQCDVPLDTLGPKGTPNKTKTHGFGSSLSYGRRYLTMLIFNVSTGEDDDGNHGDRPKPQGPRQATNATRNWMLEQLKDLHVPMQAYAIDKAFIMPDQGLDEWPLEHVPCSKGELDALRKAILAHK